MLKWWNELPHLLVGIKLLAKQRRRVYLHLHDGGWSVIN